MSKVSVHTHINICPGVCVWSVCRQACTSCQEEASAGSIPTRKHAFWLSHSPRNKLSEYPPGNMLSDYGTHQETNLVSIVLTRKHAVWLWYSPGNKLSEYPTRKHALQSWCSPRNKLSKYSTHQETALVSTHQETSLVSTVPTRKQSQWVSTRKQAY